jgi:hypothetical protein
VTRAVFNLNVCCGTVFFHLDEQNVPLMGEQCCTRLLKWRSDIECKWEDFIQLISLTLWTFPLSTWLRYCNFYNATFGGQDQALLLGLLLKWYYHITVYTVLKHRSKITEHIMFRRQFKNCRYTSHQTLSACCSSWVTVIIQLAQERFCWGFCIHSH